MSIRRGEDYKRMDKGEGVGMKDIRVEKSEIRLFFFLKNFFLFFYVVFMIYI